jgi:N-acetylglutamate synthase-like GNAT family acetyltransferase
VSVAKALLSAADLPIEDVTIERLALVAERNGDVVGLIGLEQFKALGLLRSLIVLPENRGSGVGKALVAALEKMAIDKGISELWLLTIDADAWFTQLGYRVAERELAPPAIQNTEEFASLCPGDTVLMRKDLRD